jgi:hypothetical protein
MLNTVENSVAKKTAGLAVTYRSGFGSMWTTCPDSCPLKPAPTATKEIDRDYEAAVRRAVPRKGVAFLFTHFAPSLWAEKNAPGKTVFNFSADSLKQAARHIKRGTASVAVVPADYWDDRPSKKVTVVDGVKLVRCADETTGVGCAGCGAGTPLCARPERDYGIVFTAHGASRRKAGDNSEPGGCYGSGGNVALHWRRLSQTTQPDESDGDKVQRFAKSLPPHRILRHHIAGDLGRA